MKMKMNEMNEHEMEIPIHWVGRGWRGGLGLDVYCIQPDEGSVSQLCCTTSELYQGILHAEDNSARGGDWEWMETLL